MQNRLSIADLKAKSNTTIITNAEVLMGAGNGPDPSRPAIDGTYVYRPPIIVRPGVPK